jgi:hypothetical protein
MMQKWRISPSRHTVHYGYLLGPSSRARFGEEGFSGGAIAVADVPAGMSQTEGGLHQDRRLSHDTVKEQDVINPRQDANVGNKSDTKPLSAHCHSRER